MSKLIDYFGLFLEKGFSRIVNSLVVVLLILFIANLYLNIDAIDKVLDKIVAINNTLVMSKQSLFSTLAAIIIGFNITSFTLIGNIRVNSIFMKFTSEEINKIMLFNFKSMLTSFSVLIWEFVNELIPLVYIHSLISLYVIVFMLFTVFRFGLYIGMIYKKEISNILVNVEQEKQELIKVKLLNERLDTYLKKKELEERNELKMEIKKFHD